MSKDGEKIEPIFLSWPADLCAVAGLGLEVLDDGPVVAVEEGDAIATLATFDDRQMKAVRRKLEEASRSRRCQRVCQLNRGQDEGSPRRS